VQDAPAADTGWLMNAANAMAITETISKLRNTLCFATEMLLYIFPSQIND
jgi:hypothetical protein